MCAALYSNGHGWLKMPSQNAERECYPETLLKALCYRKRKMQMNTDRWSPGNTPTCESEKQRKNIQGFMLLNFTKKNRKILER